MLKATAKQYGIRLTGELVSCSACSRAKGHRAPTPHHATRRATQPLGLVHIDTAGPYPTSLGGSRSIVIFVDSAPRPQRPYGVGEKSAAAIFSVVKRFVADMGVQRAFRTDNGTEHSNRMFVNFCNGLGICREFTAPYTPQQNGPVESAISRAFEAGHAARHGVPQLYPDIRLEEIQGCTDAAGTSLWLESLLWASECYNRAATSVNDEWLSPHKIFYGSRPPLPLPPFLQPPYHRVPRQRKTDPRARMCYFLFLGIITGGIATGSWMRRRGGSLIRATSPGTTRKHRGSTRSRPRQQNRRGISTSPWRSLCPSLRHLLHPSPLHQLPHRQRHYHHRLHERRTPRLRSPRALAANWNTRDTWRCPGGRVARPVHCAMRHGNTPIVMVYHCTMRLWCQCWRNAKQPTRLFANMAPPRTRRICGPRMHRICLHPTMCPTWTSRPMQTYGDTPCTRNSKVSYRQVLSRRCRPSS